MTYSQYCIWRAGQSWIHYSKVYVGFFACALSNNRRSGKCDVSSSTRKPKPPFPKLSPVEYLQILQAIYCCLLYIQGLTLCSTSSCVLNFMCERVRDDICLRRAFTRSIDFVNCDVCRDSRMGEWMLGDAHLLPTQYNICTWMHCVDPTENALKHQSNANYKAIARALSVDDINTFCPDCCKSKTHSVHKVWQC